MKNCITTLLLVFTCFAINSQESSNQDKWDKFTNPGTDNYFYHHFKKVLTPDIISKEKFSKTKKKIIVEFNVVNGMIENLETNAYNSELKKRIKYGFNTLDFDKLSIKSNSNFHNFSIQLIENKKGKGILKCSSVVLHETPPICNNCEKRKDFESYNLCFKKKLEKYLLKNIDSAKFSELGIHKKDIDKPFAEFSSDKRFISSSNNPFSIKVTINKNGETSVSNNAKNLIINAEVNRILNEYNFGTIVPATYNGAKNEYTYELKTSERRLVDSWVYKTSGENHLAKYFKENIPPTLINEELLDDSKNSVSIRFSLNKKGKLENITSSAKNEKLDEYLIKTFKKYPVENLKTPKQIHNLSRFSFKVIVSDDFKNRIECNNHIFSETLPIAKGCENSKSNITLKKCLQQSITNHVNRNFDSSIAGKLNLSPGIKRIYVMFRINETGEITDIKARSPHKKLTEEAIRVAKSIKIISPGYQRGNPVGIKYSLPIAFKVEDNKPKSLNPFNGINGNRNRRNY